MACSSSSFTPESFKNVRQISYAYIYKTFLKTEIIHTDFSTWWVAINIKR